MEKSDNKMIHIEIKDEETLLSACDLLHDASFDMSTMTYDSEEKHWSGKFKREFFEEPGLVEGQRKCIIFTRYTFPMAETFLSLGGVKNLEVNDRARIEIFSFNECRRRKGKYVFCFNEDMEIEVEFDGIPKGHFRDVKLLDERGSTLVFRRKNDVI